MTSGGAHKLGNDSANELQDLRNKVRSLEQEMKEIKQSTMAHLHQMVELQNRVKDNKDLVIPMVNQMQYITNQMSRIDQTMETILSIDNCSFDDECTAGNKEDIL